MHICSINCLLFTNPRYSCITCTLDNLCNVLFVSDIKYMASYTMTKFGVFAYYLANSCIIGLFCIEVYYIGLPACCTTFTCSLRLLHNFIYSIVPNVSTFCLIFDIIYIFSPLTYVCTEPIINWVMYMT